MKYNIIILIISVLFASTGYTQTHKIAPCRTSSASSFSVGTLKDLPVLTKEELKEYIEKEKSETPNHTMSQNIPLGNNKSQKNSDAVTQNKMGTSFDGTIIKEWDALSTYASATDCNGVVGPNNFILALNFSFIIYDKDGQTLLGPTTLNTFFNDVTPTDGEGAGDPVVVYDEHANRWLISQFGHNSDYSQNYIFVALSQTGDPTGSWYKWRFDLNAFPDYFKIGVREDGYYISANPLYSWDTQERFMVLERSAMLTGSANPQIISFESSDIPGIGASPYAVFQVPLPVDNDGAFAPSGEPGVFVTINDDAWGGTDQLWIWELKPDWNTPANSTFQKTQMLDVEAFSSQFNTGSSDYNAITCIEQPGTTTKLDAVSTTMMYRAQYRNFGTSQNIVCYHTVNIDGQNQAGLRWYELEKTDGDWYIRQQGTYAPDTKSRWLGSIAMNGDHEIAIGYTIGGPNTYPGICFAGQSSTEYQNASGIFDVSETNVYDGTMSKTSNSRWVDYSNLTIDPTNDHTFWYVNSYVKTSSESGSYISAFEFSVQALSANFMANNTTPVINSAVNFTDQSTGTPSSWTWQFTPNTINFVGGTNENSQNPQVEFTEAGTYSVTLEVSDGTDTETLTKDNYINVLTTGIEDIAINNNYKIYNNNNKVYVNVPNNDNVEVLIYNSLGKLIIDTELKSSPIIIDNKGMYVVVLKTSGKMYSGKIIIN